MIDSMPPEIGFPLAALATLVFLIQLRREKVRMDKKDRETAMGAALHAAGIVSQAELSDAEKAERQRKAQEAAARLSAASAAMRKVHGA